MTLKKIGEILRPCSHPSHDPPNMIVLPPGIYEHTCPACGYRVEFTVRNARYRARRTSSWFEPGYGWHPPDPDPSISPREV